MFARGVYTIGLGLDPTGLKMNNGAKTVRVRSLRFGLKITPSNVRNAGRIILSLKRFKNKQCSTLTEMIKMQWQKKSKIILFTTANFVPMKRLYGNIWQMILANASNAKLLEPIVGRKIVHFAKNRTLFLPSIKFQNALGVGTTNQT